jgi:hypothetical protein
MDMETCRQTPPAEQEIAMQDNRLIDLAKRRIRAQVCTHCYQRPIGSENDDWTIVRACEPTCAIFVSLPQLMRVAERPIVVSAEKVMLDNVCQTCERSASAGDYCAERLARTCPLSRYACDVMEIIETIQQTPPGA